MPWPETDPDGAGEPPRVLDAEIAAAAKALFFARDLVRPGPRSASVRGQSPGPAGAAPRGRRRSPPPAGPNSPSCSPRDGTAAATATTRRRDTGDARGWWPRYSPPSSSRSPRPAGGCPRHRQPRAHRNVAAGTGSAATDLPRFEPDLTTSVATRPAHARIGAARRGPDLTGGRRGLLVGRLVPDRSTAVPTTWQHASGR